MEQNFDKTKYDMELRKKTKKQFNTDLYKDEKEELDRLLKQENITKTEFIRNAITNLKEKIKMKKYYVVLGTELFKRKNYKWEYDVCIDKPREAEIFDNYEKAKEFYDNLKLYDNISGIERYADFKEIYSYNEKDLEDEEPRFSLEKMKKLEELYLSDSFED